MRTYVGLRYVSFAVPIAAVMALATVLLPDPGGRISVTFGEAITQALFWSAPIATWLTWRDLVRKNVWPLVDNLRISRITVLTIPPTIQLVAWAVVAIFVP